MLGDRWDIYEMIPATAEKWLCLISIYWQHDNDEDT